MNVNQELGEMRTKLRSATYEVYVTERSKICDWMETQPSSVSAEIRGWIAALARAVKEGREHFSVLGPFVDGLIERRDPDSGELLGQLMVGSEYHLSESLAEGLGDMGEAGRGAIPYLERLLSESGDLWIRTKATVSLGLVGGGGSEALIAALDDPDAYVRSAAIASLGPQRADEGTPKVMKLLESDPDDKVRAAAARALAKWNVRTALPVLQRLVEKEREPILLSAYDDAISRLREDVRR